MCTQIIWEIQKFCSLVLIATDHTVEVGSVAGDLREGLLAVAEDWGWLGDRWLCYCMNSAEKKSLQKTYIEKIQ